MITMNNYFCVMPFFGAEYNHTGFTTPCCLLAPNADINQLKTDMLNGQRPSACKKCWALEDANLTSDRILKNSAFDFYANKDIRYVEEECRNGNYHPRIFKIYTSNLCNSTCVTCDHNASTAWGALTKNKKFIQIHQSELDDLPVKDFVMLNFVGGEPLYEKKNFNILERLVAADNTDCFISFTTNGSTQLSDNEKELLSKFKNVNISVSIDGVGPVFEYLRYPLKWSDLLENLEYYKQCNFNISISYTISNLNILYYDETVDWFNKNKLSYNHNLVEEHKYFVVDALPEHVKLAYPSLKKFFNPHSIEHDLLFRQFCRAIQIQDRLKNISIKDYLPALAKNM